MGKKPRRAVADPSSSKAAYVVALRWLTAREQSEAQLRERLARRGYIAQAIDPAIARLLAEGTLNDRRAASSVARTEARVRRRGPRRIMARLLAMGIDRDLAREVVHDLFGETDEAELLEQAVEKRLRGHAGRLADPRERRKVLAQLVRQGFSASAISALIRKRSRQQ